MIVRLARNSILAITTLTVSSFLPAQPPAQPALPDSTPPTAQAAPIERHPPSEPIGRGYRSGMQGQSGRSGDFHGGEGQFRGGNFRGGHSFGRPEGDRMGGGLHIGPPGIWWKNPVVAQRLALTPDQVKKMDGIVQESRLQLIDLRANLEKQQVLLEPILNANPLDTAKATAQIDKVAQSRADLEKANAKMLLGIRGVLTPDQWTKLSSRQIPNGGASAPDGQAAPTPSGGRERGLRGGGPPPAANDLVAPIDVP